MSRTITWNDQGQEFISGADNRSASASGAADSLYHSEWEDHWWSGPETWASGGTWQNATYDDYNYQYQWTKTWQGQGAGGTPRAQRWAWWCRDKPGSSGVSPTTPFVPCGWWRYTDGEGNSSSTSWGGPWSDSYDETVTYPGFYEGAYYGMDYGGGREEYFAYLGDAFSEYAGGDTGLFPFAYSRAEVLLGRSQLSGEPSHGIRSQNAGVAGKLQAAGPVSAHVRSSEAGREPRQPAEQAAQESSFLVPAAGEADVAGQSHAPSVAGRQSGVASSQERGGGSAGLFGKVRDFFGLYAYYFSQNLDYYQAGLDVAGIIPVVGEPLDAINAGISAARGDWTGAGLSAASMIPIYGDAVGKGGKLGRYAAKYGDEFARVIEKHHLLPREFVEKFARKGLNIDDYVVEMERARHRLKPDGIHTGSENWNKRWRDFFKKYPNAKREKILDFLQQLRKEFGI